MGNPTLACFAEVSAFAEAENPKHPNAAICRKDCERGYFPVGTSQMTCQSDGTFLKGEMRLLPSCHFALQA